MGQRRSVETLHWTEISHAWCVFLFQLAQSFQDHCLESVDAQFGSGCAEGTYRLMGDIPVAGLVWVAAERRFAPRARLHTNKLGISGTSPQAPVFHYVDRLTFDAETSDPRRPADAPSPAARQAG